MSNRSRRNSVKISTNERSYREQILLIFSIGIYDMCSFILDAFLKPCQV